MNELDRMELSRGEDRSAWQPARRVHDGVRRWTGHALAMYEAAFPAGATELLPAAAWDYRYRPADGGRDAAGFRIKAWGRYFKSADGRFRELRLPVNRLRPRTPVERAIAALVAAEGDPDVRVEHVRVVQFALTDGRTEVLFDGTRADAVAYYRDNGAPAVRALLDQPEYRPGSACASCAIAPLCPELPRGPGLLGITDRGQPRRSWSPTTARSHRGCPARGYLRSLRLPVDDSVERSAAAERGRAVHAYLAARHSGPAPRPCGAEVPVDWVPDGYDLPPVERELGARLLSHHAEVCPFRLADRHDPEPEPLLVFDDPEADLLVLTEPDLLYRDGGSWVWRETKTSGGGPPVRKPLATYPQLALAVRVVAAGGVRADRIELEVLRPEGPDLRIIDPRSAHTRAEAAAVLRDWITGWHRERLFEAAPGPECARCEVARWCSATRPQPSTQEAP
ncbi:PD-(D/E)XK nuclease family protein [Kitasatospora saccharophila]